MSVAALQSVPGRQQGLLWCTVMGGVRAEYAAPASPHAPMTMPDDETPTIHKNLLRHLLLARSDWMEASVMQSAKVAGYPYVTTAMNRLFAHMGGRPLGLSELARRMLVSRQAVHRLALDAAELGLVEFVPSDEDGRVKLLRFTPKGWRMSERAAASFMETERMLAAHIGEANVEELRRILALPWPAADELEPPPIAP